MRFAAKSQHAASLTANQEALVKVEGVSKKFCRSLKRSLWYGLCDIAQELSPFGRRDIAEDWRLEMVDAAKSSIPLIPDTPAAAARDEDLREGEFYAVRDVSFELRRGECLGLIGHNGAGKTTLLKMLNGLIKPDRGRIELNGRVGALIALGAGFNPILTGRENIYINGSVLGLSKKEIEEKIDEIIDFAEIGDFIDMPVQNYSSGMQVRLGFAVATTLDPDVLILDEVLAVGDASFRHKCYNRLNKLTSRSAVILVSHSMDYICQMCHRVAVMNKGKYTMYNDVYEGIREYNFLNTSNRKDLNDGGKVEAVYPPVSMAYVKLSNSVVPYGGRLIVEVAVDVQRPLPEAVACFSATNLNDQTVIAVSTALRDQPLHLPQGKQKIVFCIDPLLLHEGRYTWSFHLSEAGSIEYLVWFMRCGEFSVTSHFRPMGDIPYLPSSECVSVTSRE